ncbi:hypothetical protein K6V98_04925 [Collinsella sp. AGMB00827]|uniref:Uncharacterized protein n=1 Tax=Collinsella ureilytica TaxID=2869515 RepID=A0ABS7MK60_9ACTN|nr:hypothetical protein [Collinsella urealyticum]MBY4797698.1 hypothetical protein [Collinsella urealyticum]
MDIAIAGMLKSDGMPSFTGMPHCGHASLQASLAIGASTSTDMPHCG